MLGGESNTGARLTECSLLYSGKLDNTLTLLMINLKCLLLDRASLSMAQVPANKFRVLLVYPNLTMMLVPSIAIAIFTSTLRKSGYVVDLFDTTHYVVPENSSPQNRVKFLQAREFDEKNDLGVRFKTDLAGDYKRKVEAFSPNLIVYSVVEDCFRQCLTLMEAIKDLDIPHIVGGVFPTAAPQVCIENDLINVIGIGEGESILPAFAEAVRLERDLDSIPGTWVKSQGAIQKNPRPPLVDIETYIPDFSLFDSARFNRPMGGKIFRTIPVESFRGCPYQCTYCNSPMQVQRAKSADLGSFLRRKSMPVLRDEINSLVEKYEPEFLYFIDDSFTARPKKEIDAFCEMYEEFQIPFWFNTRPEATDLEMLKKLREVGAYRMSLGIESGNEEFRQKILRRRGSNEALTAAFDIAHKSEIPFSLNLIIGMPGETRGRIFDTVEFVRTLAGYDTITVSIFTPYHGTVLREVAVKNGWLPQDYITKHTTSSSALKMPPPYVSPRDIDGLMRVLPLYIYFPKEEWPEIRKAEAQTPEGDKVLAYYSRIYRTEFLKEDQFQSKGLTVNGSTGCRTNEKDSFVVPGLDKPAMKESELSILTM